MFVNGAYVFYVPPESNGNVTDSFAFTVSDTFGGTAHGTVVLTVPRAPLAGAAISPELSNGVVRLKFSGVPGQVYLVQRATNMVEPVYWETLASLVADAYGRFAYNDTNPPPNAAFYRAAAP